MDNLNYNPIILGATLAIAAIMWYLPDGLGGVRHTFVCPNSNTLNEES